MCSLVAALSTKGDKAKRFSASALLTYWKVSVCNFLIQGTILVMMVLASRILQKSARREDAAVRTSDSESDKNEQKLGKRCSLA
jgi:small neutral amino acid transporter SnatA (MarC family)